MRRFRSVYTRSAWLPFSIDAVLVVVFTILGRASHEEALDVAGIAGTAAPFLAALLLAWAIVRLARMEPAAPWPSGVLVWVVTVTSGLALRILFGGTAAVPFVLVTAGVLLVFLVLPRLVGFSRGESASRMNSGG